MFWNKKKKYDSVQTQTFTYPLDMYIVINELAEKYIPQQMLNFMYHTTYTREDILKNYPRKHIKNSISQDKVVINATKDVIETHQKLITIYKDLRKPLEAKSNDNDLCNVQYICDILLQEKISSLEYDIIQKERCIKLALNDVKKHKQYLNTHSKVLYCLYLIDRICEKYNIDKNKLRHFCRLSFFDYMITKDTTKSLDKFIRELRFYIGEYKINFNKLLESLLKLRG